jgi:hypothetical protein
MRRFNFSLLLFFLVCVTDVSAENPAPSFTQQLHNAYFLGLAKEFEASEEAFETLLEAHPNELAIYGFYVDVLS